MFRAYRATRVGLSEPRPRRAKLVRDLGVFAPRARVRPRGVPAPSSPTPLAEAVSCPVTRSLSVPGRPAAPSPGPSSSGERSSPTPSTCPRCGGTRRVIALVPRSSTARAISSTSGFSPARSFALGPGQPGTLRADCPVLATRQPRRGHLSLRTRVLYEQDGYAGGSTALYGLPHAAASTCAAGRPAPWCAVSAAVAKLWRGPSWAGHPNAIKALARCGQGYSLSDEGLAPVAYPMMPAISQDYPLPRKDQKTARGLRLYETFVA